MKKRGYSVVVFGIAFSSIISSLAGEPSLGRWLWWYPFPPPTGIQGLWNSESHLIAHGTKGKLFWRRLDGTPGGAGSWNQSVPPTSETIEQIIRPAGKYVAVGSGGLVMTATVLGGEWSLAASPTAAHLKAVAYGGGRYVAVGAGSTIVTSPDAVVWEPAVPPQPGLALESVTYGPSGFVAAGSRFDEQAGQSSAVILRSEDGLAWEAVEHGLPPSTLTAVTAGNGKYVAAGTGGILASSADASVWQSHRTDEETDLLSVAFGNGYFLAMDRGQNGYTSVDGMNWTWELGTFLPGQAFSFGGDRFILVDERASTFQRPEEAWTHASTPGNFGIVALESFENQLVAVGSHTFAYAERAGSLHHATNISFNPPASSVSLVNNQLIATMPLDFYYSSNSTQWLHGETVIQANTRKIAFGNGSYVAVTDEGEIFASDDARDWTSAFRLVEGTFAKVIFAEGLFVAVGTENIFAPPPEQRGVVIVSENGTEWSRAFTQAGSSFSDLAFGEGKYVLVGHSGSGTPRGLSLTSVDGRSWAAPGSGLEELSLEKIAYGGGIFLAAGTAQSSGEPRLVSSSDGQAWNPEPYPMENPVTAMTFGLGRFFLGGPEGELIAAEPRSAEPLVLEFIEAAVTSAGNITLHLLSSGPGAVQIESSSDLQSWAPRHTTTNTSPAEPLIIELLGSSPMEFFRARSLPD